ncbi:hypothetical protein [Halovivax sp.]|uniref:hypothetical protein n=1 Tax=Halovivax sp. TaxID=1935978 RepID=UPI0025BB1907|nr:hypothetical protein [Halovivax sp.]
MTSRFRDWLGCPECAGDAEVGVLAHELDVVLECYGCGHVAEFTIGEDVPFNGSVPADVEGLGDDTGDVPPKPVGGRDSTTRRRSRRRRGDSPAE